MAKKSNGWSVLLTVSLLTSVAFILVSFQFRNYFLTSDIHWDVDEITSHPNTPIFDGIKNECPPINTSFLKKPKPFVALASFPGSGNTWTRELLEGLTGIYTGSIYTDGMTTFSGSKRCPLHGEVYILKTHKESARISHKYCIKKDARVTHFEKAIFILRNPYDALVADFNRIKAGKVAVAKQSEFASNAWERFVKTHIKRWTTMVMFWTESFQKPYHLLIYEDLKTKMLEELVNIARFLQIEVTEQTLQCIFAEKSTYKRNRKPSWLSKELLFDQQLRQIVNNEIRKTLQKHKNDRKLSHTLSNYLLV